jgi:hypothetical protein
MAADGSDREVWERVNDLFHRALERVPSERAAFLDDASDDPRVKEEVRSLLEAHDRTSNFIDTTAAARAVPPAPVRIGDYEIRGVLGEGGMGVVYMAEDLRLGRMVALKAIAPHHVGDPSRRARLRREARAAAALHHPAIATVFALEEIGEHLYIAGEYVPGETLRDEIARGPLDPLRAIDTALAVARALAVAHEAGIVHRDLKPENVMRTPAGDVKILDFGLARFTDASHRDAASSADGTVLGTPAYMSPEQIRGGAVDARSDLFALGVVLYELVTGVRPFRGSDAASTVARILESEPDRLRDLTGALPSGALGALERVVLTCLRKRPADRFPSARHLISALEEARAALVSGVPAAGGGTAETEGREPHGAEALWWWRFHQLAATAGYALLVVPLWRVRDLSAAFGMPLFAAGLAAATAAGAIRLHLWFMSRVDRPAWHEHHRRAAPWRRIADALMAAVLGGEGVIALLERENWGLLLVAAAVAVLVSFALIEPATARAAFGEAGPRFPADSSQEL